VFQISKWSSQKNTYGWARAEVLGALVNSVFLVALCFTIFVEALQRLFVDEHIHNPDMMLIVGGLGLAVNLIGLLLFQGHAHSHGGGGHGELASKTCLSSTSGPS
jgi:zinc transporter 1